MNDVSLQFFQSVKTVPQENGLSTILVQEDVSANMAALLVFHFARQW